MNGKRWLLPGLLLGIALSGAAGEKEAPPVAKFKPIGIFFSGKNDANPLTEIRVPGNGDTIWRCGNDEWKTALPALIVAVPAGLQEQRWEWRNGEQSGAVTVKFQPTSRRSFVLEQGLQLTAPRLIRRNETCGIYVTCWNRWSLPVAFRLRLTVSQALPGVEDRTLTPDITAPPVPQAPPQAEKKPAKQPGKDQKKKPRHPRPDPEPKDRFHAGWFYCENLTIRGAALPEAEWHCRYVLQIPGLTLLERTVRLIPAGELPELRTDCTGNWTDAEGCRVVPVLPLRDLQKQRKYELLRRSGRKLFSAASTLVIGNDFGSGEKQFSVLLENRKTPLQFASWKDGSAPEQIAEALNLLRETNAEEVVILIPPPGLRHADDGEWLDFLELLETCAWERKSVRKVRLALMPAPAGCGENGAFLQALRKMVRDRDTELLEVESFWKPEDREAAFREVAGEPALESDLPVQAAEEIAAIVAGKNH